MAFDNINFILGSNWFLGLSTIFAGVAALIVYYIEQRRRKRDTAKIILQEIRRAEDIISDYKLHGGYKFTRKIVPNNSWANNIHLFVDDLTADEIDKISNLYTGGIYLDSLIQKISDLTFAAEISNGLPRVVPAPASRKGTAKTSKNPVSAPPIRAPWKSRLDAITSQIEPIYNSTIVAKLKKIAKVR